MDTTAPPISVLIADDHAIVRSALRALLEAEGEFVVVAEAATVDEAARKVLGYKPRVMVLDLNMPDGLSIHAIPRMQQVSPSTSIVVLTMENEPRLARQAIQLGAAGFVLKEAADEELASALRAAVRGERYLNPFLGGLLAAIPDRPQQPPDGLTHRELQVLRLLAAGHTNAEISSRLHLSVRTVEGHRSHIQAKVNRVGRAELVAYARERALAD